MNFRRSNGRRCVATAFGDICGGIVILSPNKMNDSGEGFDAASQILAHIISWDPA